MSVRSKCYLIVGRPTAGTAMLRAMTDGLCDLIEIFGACSSRKAAESVIAVIQKARPNMEILLEIQEIDFLA